MIFYTYYFFGVKAFYCKNIKNGLFGWPLFLFFGIIDYNLQVNSEAKGGLKWKNLSLTI